MIAFAHLRSFLLSAEIVHGDLADLPNEITILSHVGLRKISAADARALFSIIENNPEIRHFTAWPKEVWALEDTLPRLAAYSNTDFDGRFVIIARDIVVGHIGAFAGQNPHEYGIGYFLDKSARGNGYITMAVSVLVAQLKAHLGAQEIFLQIKPDNPESIAVAKRLGCVEAETVMGVDFPVEQQRWRLSFDS